MAKWILLILLLLAQPAVAEMYTSTRTIGYQIAQADCVVRAVITSVDVVPPPGPTPDSTNWVKIRLEVHETLLGPPAASLTFYCDNSRIPEWTSNKSEQLFFLETGAHAGSHHPGILDLLAMVSWADIFVDPIPLPADGHCAPLLTDDLRILSSTQDLLTEARHVSTMPRLSPPTTLILLPENLAKSLNMSYSQWLDLALTESTFKAARQWIRSPDPQMQWCGVEVLVHQKSPENIAALQHFAWSITEAPRYGPKARARLLAVLNTWGVTDIPPFIHPSPVFNLRNPTAWASLAAWLLVPAAYVAVTCLLRKRTRILTTLWWACISAIVVLGIRSFWPQDAVTRGGFDIALERGNMYIDRQERAHNGLPSPLLICTPQELLSNQSMAYSVGRGYPLNDLGEMPLVDLFAADSYAEKFWPTKFFGLTPMPWRDRFRGPTYQIPLWLPLLLLLVPRLLLLAWRWLKARRTRQARGFPVVRI